MNVRLKLILTTALLLLVMNPVLAEKRPLHKEGAKQRPTFSSLDADTYGSIDFTEFSSHQLPHGNHQTVFSIIDTDSDGLISENEYVTHTPPRNKKGGMS